MYHITTLSVHDTTCYIEIGNKGLKACEALQCHIVLAVLEYHI